MPSRILCAAAVAFLLAGCGPGKLNENKKYDMEGGDAQVVDLPSVTKAQKITVDFTSSNDEVTVLLFKEADAKDLFAAEPEKALGYKRGKKESFTVDVPENTATRVIIRNVGKKSEVQLKITN